MLQSLNCFLQTFGEKEYIDLKDKHKLKTPTDFSSLGEENRKFKCLISCLRTGL